MPVRTTLGKKREHPGPMSGESAVVLGATLRGIAGKCQRDHGRPTGGNGGGPGGPSAITGEADPSRRAEGRCAAVGSVPLSGDLRPRGPQWVCAHRSCAPGKTHDGVPLGGRRGCSPIEDTTPPGGPWGPGWGSAWESPLSSGEARGGWAGQPWRAAVWEIAIRLQGLGIRGCGRNAWEKC